MGIEKGPRTVARSQGARVARAVALVGVMAATIECGKLALSFIPNVEVVTLLLAIYGYVFGWLGVVASVVFVCIEPLIYGFNTWVVTYILYWPTVALVFALMGRLRILTVNRGSHNLKTRVIATATAVALTVWFGVLSSLVDVGLLTGYFDNFFYRFGIYYARGIVFYIVQVVCNAVLFPLLFVPLSKLLGRISSQEARRVGSRCVDEKEHDSPATDENDR